MRNRLVEAVAILGVACVVQPAFAAGQGERDALDDLDLGKLLNVEVSTATKTAEGLDEAPAVRSKRAPGFAPVRPSATRARTSRISSGRTVMMLTTPRKASAPYSAEAGPRMISICATDDSGISSTPSQFPEVRR